MAFGVLEDLTLVKVPGTVVLTNSDANTLEESQMDGKLKKIGSITLLPQPTDSSHDPLNWPWLRKNVLLVVIASASGVTVSLGPMISPGLPLLAMQYQKSLDMISTYLVGLFILWTGVFTFFTSAAASVWGKRMVFVLSAAALLALNAWGFFVKSFEEFVAMRLLQGFASAPFETLVTSTIQDLFFVHQRGQKMAIWGLMSTCGVLLGQVISGVIIERLGVKYTFGISAMIFVPLLIATFFFVPETVYQRGTHFKMVDIVSDEKITTTMTFRSNVPDHSQHSAYAVFRGRVSNESFLRQLIKPFPLFIYPAVVFGSFIYGSFFTWLVALSVLSVPMFAAPPYNLTPSQVGLTNLPLLVVGLVGSPVSGWMADKVIRCMAKRNNGIYEPEFRLTLMIPGALLSTIGFFGLGSSIAQGAKIGWPLAFISLHSLAIPFASQAAFTYVVDCHPEDANQAFVTIGLVKAILTFLVTTSVNGWFASQGAKMVFWSIGGLNLGICLLTIPVYVFGKKFRALVRKARIEICHKI
ncbi:uncharacterized protein A1O9_07629 [Exophiala aquamarina CBS 119918]|uniref:Major facilitator superfamily (MFS) profile domain-containing protein n=1 Tax=Exophiala aquamarina CBS 119918 TaxID=1182545 RepID=A0A072P9T5_9EURO|nr:uncharacterized protein A1O9_07629 [Exophiala aquamarina CBS 119918]KEF56048.1 hypothetical protein A1O9_07629 [Exophiala aquamarina CBS 119918]